MTYLQWLRRYVELAMGRGNWTATPPAAAPGSPWLADTWRDRFEQMLKRAEARLHPKDFGPIETLFCDEELLERPDDAIAALQARYPDAETIQLHPASVPFLVELCKTLGKPVNFVHIEQGRAPVVAQRLAAVAGAWFALDANQVLISFRAPRPWLASPASTSPVGGSSTGSSRPRSIRCWQPRRNRHRLSPAVSSAQTSPGRLPWS